MPADDLDLEQAYIDAAYRHLARMRDRAERLLDEMQGVDPDLDMALLRRVRALREEPRALCFGRLDGRDGSVYYVGRRHVEDEEAEPLVIEWRAPVAVPYYRASRRDDMGLRRRRQFVVEGRKLLSIGDDVFDAADVPDDSVRGGEALMLELQRARTGQMVDIVSTIQPEQDEVIRADPTGIMVVQGGPGSGKTAVGLHRAAFLLYGDDAMARANVLVVGPNKTFLRYIGHVLPSLGEHAVVQATLLGLVPEVDSAIGASPDPVSVDRLKGDGRMAVVIARALALRRTSIDEDLVVPYSTMRLRVDGRRLAAEADRLAASSLPYADGREALRAWVVARLNEAHLQTTGVLPTDSEAFDGAMRRSIELKAALDRRWPSVPAATLIGDLLTKPAVMSAAARDVLAEHEQKLLHRRRAKAWTAADAPLVDEAKALIAGQSRTYGHVIVDEAQDLSPMQLRMLGRRVPSGNMTLLGDLAQAVGAWAHRDWAEVGEWLPASASFRVAELRYGYRSTRQIIEFAARLLPEAAPHVPPTTSVRSGATDPAFSVGGHEDLPQRLLAEVSSLATRWPTVGVVTASASVDAVLAWLRAPDRSGRPRIGDAHVDGLTRAITVVAAESAKGLEFDSAVVVEPSAIVAERPDRPSGLRLLYVALTRPTQHLSIVASGEMPAALL